MNSHLQTILQFIQRAEHLSEEEKNALVKEAKAADKDLEITAFKLGRTEKVKHTTAILLQETIEELESKRKAVETQNRELEIEAALEKVRSCSLAMHKSEELQDVINTVFDRLGDLGIETNTASIVIYKEGSNEMEEWIQNDERTISTQMIAPFYEKTKLGGDLRDSITTRKDLLSALYSKEEKNDWFSFVFEHSDFKRTSDARKKYVLDAESYCISIATIRNGAVCLGKYSNQLFSEHENDILKRFAHVFEQAYIRFLDLQKAEAQAREAQIEAALEKVRSRSLAMHHSEELKEVVAIVFEKFHELNFQADGGVGIVIFNDEAKALDYWAANPDYISATCFPTPYFDHVINNDIWKIRESGGDFNSRTYSYEEKNSFWNYLIEHTEFKHLPEENKTMMYESQSMTNAFAFSKHSAIGVITYLGKPFSEEQIEIIKRFARVFEQAYTRFLDLQKAEAQARESQIQLALERVRARTMAMQHSDELKGAATLLFQQAKSLGVPAYSCGYNIWEENEKEFTSWMSTQDGNDINAVFNVPLTEDPNFIRFAESRQNGEAFFVLELRGKRMQEHYQYLKTIPAFKAYFDYAISAGFALPETQIHHLANFSHGNLLFITLEPCPEFHDVFKRFAAVFDQTYTRFLDLQKAEAQGREAQIQLALERVRARTMAMQHSDELSETVYILFQQFKQLGENPDQATIGIINEEERVIEYWVTMYGNQLNRVFKFSIDEPHVTQKIYNAWKKQEKSLVIDLSGQELREFSIYRESMGGAKSNEAETRRIINVAIFSKGLINVQSNEYRSKESINLLERFAAVFEQTYTRFLDLQKAEAQARESQIQLALERVRARTMAMHQSDELREVVYVLYDQLMQLGFRHGATNIVLIKADTGDTQWWFTGFGRDEFPDSYFVNYFDHPAFNEMLQRWKSKEKFARILVSGESKVKFDKNFLFESDFKRAPEEIKLKMASLESVEFSLAYMKYGAINLGPEAISDEQAKVLQRFATVFEQTYTRFLDLQKSEAQARESQIQLALERVRARTMAMQRSEELSDAATVLFQQVIALGVPLWTCGFGLWELGDTVFTWYPGSPDGGILPPCRIPLTEHPVFISFDESRRRGDELFVYEKEGEFQKGHYQYMLSVPGGLGKMMQGILDAGIEFPRFQVDHIALFSHGNLAFITYKHFPEMHDVFKRFAKVFEQTYTRFLDLQKAETQAREAKIEAALERTRTQSMLMQHSNELDNTLRVFHEQVLLLGIHSAFSFLWLPDENKDRHIFWAAWAENLTTDQSPKDGSTIFKSKAINYPLDRNEPATAQCLVDWKSDESVHSYHVPPAEVENYFAAWKELLDGVEKQKPEYFPGGLYYVEAFMKYGCFGVMIQSPLPEEEKKILSRFAIEFERTYTRFLDLQKAEAQAREAQIEAALEKVRSRSLAMHKSDELKEAGELLWNELTKLGIESLSSGYVLMDKAKNIGWFYAPSPATGKIAEPLGLCHTETKEMLKALSYWKKQEPLSVVEMNEEETIAHQTFVAEKGLRMDGTISHWITAEKLIALSPKRLFLHNFNFKQGYLMIVGANRLTDQQVELMLRFTKVFQQTYTRFLDLQKAEAQAREAQIEAALERVRSRSMGMQKSEELKEVIQVVYEQFVHLNIHVDHTGFVIDYKARDDYNIWIADPLGVPSQVTVPYFDSVYYNRFNEAKAKGEDFFATNLTFEEKNKFYQKLFEYVPGLPEEAKEFYFTCPGLAASTVLLENVCLYIENFSGTPYSDEENATLMRFGKVFQQTYTRFHDLKQAEAQALEAIKRASVDRVRAEIASMRTTNDLERIQPLIWNELTTLGVPFIRCGVFIMDEEQEKVHMHLSTPDGKAIAVFHLPYDAPFNIPQIVKNWHKKSMYKQHWDAQKFNEFTKYLVQQGAIASGEKYLTENRPSDLYLHFLPFLQGMLYVGI